MSNLFLKGIEELRNKLIDRDERIIHIEQLKYLNDIFDILELSDE